MRNELVQKLFENADFKSQFTFLNEEQVIKEYGSDLYKVIYEEFIDHWSYELSERLESIDIKALITAAVDKAIQDTSIVD